MNKKTALYTSLTALVLASFTPLALAQDTTPPASEATVVTETPASNTNLEPATETSGTTSAPLTGDSTETQTPPVATDSVSAIPETTPQEEATPPAEPTVSTPTNTATAAETQLVPNEAPTAEEKPIAELPTAPTTDKTTSSTPETNTPLTFDSTRLSMGDFSYLVGTWKNGEGHTYTISADGLVTYGSGNGFGRLVTDGTNLALKLYHPDGTPVRASGIVGGSVLLAGKTYPELFFDKTDFSDSSRDRLYFGQSLAWKPENFFYRLAAGKTETTAQPNQEIAVKPNNTAKSTDTKAPALPSATKEASKKGQAATTGQATNKRPDKPQGKSLPKTGEASSLLGLLGTGLASLGFWTSKRRR